MSILSRAQPCHSLPALFLFFFPFSLWEPRKREARGDKSYEPVTGVVVTSMSFPRFFFFFSPSFFGEFKIERSANRRLSVVLQFSLFLRLLPFFFFLLPSSQPARQRKWVTVAQISASSDVGRKNALSALPLPSFFSPPLLFPIQHFEPHI